MFFAFQSHCLRLLVKKLRTLNKIYSRQNVRYTHRRKLYRVSDVFEEGYNELINVAINLALTCIAQNAKRIKTVLAYFVWLCSFQLRDANLVFRPPINYFMLASFFTISTLRLTGLAARGLRYRYGEKISL